MGYQLNLTFDPSAIQSIYAADLWVTIVKSVGSSPLSGGDLPIAWSVFQPFQANSVTWQDSYNIYATTTVLQSGAMIAMTSTTPEPVQIGQLYTLENGMFVSSAGGSATAFTAANQSGREFNLGLSQQAVVNGSTINAPLNAVTILNGEQAAFTPEETVSVFLSNAPNCGMVLSQIYEGALTVTLTSQAPVANIGFNNASNSFYLMPSAA